MLKIIILSCLVVAVYSVSPKYKEKAMENLSQTLEACVPEVGANDDDIAELMQKKPPSRREGKCLVACLTKKMGLMKDGKPNREGALITFAPLKADDPDAYAKLFQAIDKCSAEIRAITETDECEIAVKAGACIHRAGKEAGVDTHQLLG